ncbi:MAG: TraR/DksA C4-type zinc finger protein [Candidatus Cloacimonetes bacterium]|jgi:RNA polymerase-binding transcription factor DksA|nr:TraR/DksA family transcriptional regulator [Candidatus Cloacimonadota bacterium]MDY0337087.1 TraR/DksA C4-type zinc finger protein [Candidatus Cloacimonadaceae bacterium]MCB5269032.1 TraR/DksA family transcriptional regulator [Candidatus Cloacimonadota bacterium]MCK9334414.1 TraR/DksA family transcriptional regulator [Candidatus Cloacimonadota bacterium]MDD2543915.1 TraR/DksA C4-type zinc finger protein [Candidatus Cloacimonadota bacterium]
MAIKKLSAERLKYFEELIRTELTESMAYIENINKEQSVGARESSGDLSSYAYHQADQGSDTNLMEHTVMMMESEREKIRLLNDAMRRIQDGTFGICEMCGDLIPDKRLEILPYATLCIDCKGKMEEKKRKQRR